MRKLFAPCSFGVQCVCARCLQVLKPVLDFQTAIVRGDLDEATEILKDVPESEHSSVARFLESQGLKEHALEVIDVF